MVATFSSWFLGPYKVGKIGFGLFLYALQHAKRTSDSFMGAILEEYLVYFQYKLSVLYTIHNKILI